MGLKFGKGLTKLALMTATIVLIASCGAKGPGPTVSPDGKISVTVTTSGGATGDALAYRVIFAGRPVVMDSPLGIDLDNGSIGAGCTVISQSASTHDETYPVTAGKSKTARDHYNEQVITLQNSEGITFDVVVRAYDDGVAFRYRFPAQDGLDTIDITGEKTAFVFTDDHEYWGLHLKGYTTSYETDYTNATLKNITPGDLTALPILVKVDDTVWVAVTEANLTDYAGMYLRGCSSGDNVLRADLAPHPDSTGVKVHAKASCETPWRVLMIADHPGRLIESNIVLNLNDPCAIDDSWIRPGKTAWDWWSGQTVKGAGFEGSMDNRTMKHYIDFASETGLEYMLVDAGWYGDHRNGEDDITTMIPEIDVPELVAYGKARNVDIVLWVNWRGVDRQMNEAFPLYQSWGVKGVKVDYMDRDDQEMVDFYHRTVKKAAEHKLLVDFHGAYKPTGIRRTYPNLITREGVMGLEYCKWSDRITPTHDCTIPFTRMLAGPLDYTPGGFSNTAKGQFTDQNKEPMTQGTRCHQLALYVIFESPYQMLVDYPGNYRGQPGIEFLRHVPATWDESKVLEGEPGEYIVMARQRGDEWYLGGITDWSPRTLNVPLSFLGAGEYAAEIYADGSDAATNAESVTMSQKTVTSGDAITIDMKPGGGYAVRLYPKK